MAFVPERLVQAPLTLGCETEHLLAKAESAVSSLSGLSDDLPAISRFLLRSEAIASSRIEGIAPSARQVALAELGQREAVQGISAPAQMVANNMSLVREATTRLVHAPLVTVGDVVELHRSLLRDEPHHHGIRTVQNWIGGSDWHPMDADFVPPSPDRVAATMGDLVDYMNGASHAPIVQAALVHAQFETIHPFTDGNGRVGRALVHSVLTRRGLTPDSVLPVSLVLSTLRERYVDGLQTFREAGATGTARSGREEWIAFFAEVTLLASEQATQLSSELAEIRDEWTERLAGSRQLRGAQRALRSDSATALILADLVGTPVLTVDTAQRIHGVSRVAAQRALDELHTAEILTRRSIGSGRDAYVSGDVLDLITWAERRLASTKFDTRKAPPRHGVPAPPER